MKIVQWYLQTSVLERASLFLILIVYMVVMVASFRSLQGSHNHVTWYRGVHASPVFQLLMWLTILPLVIPALIVVVNRRRNLRAAPFIGNIRSKKFHIRDCEYQERISSDFFRYPLWSEGEARKRGFQPCNFCAR